MATFPLSARVSTLVSAAVALGYSAVTLVWVVAPAYLGTEGLGSLAGDPAAILFWTGIAVGLGALAGVATYLLIRYVPLLPVYLVGLLVLGWVEHVARRRLGGGWLPEPTSH